MYKPIFDKLDAQAAKELAVLDKSVLWSRKYQKKDFVQLFVMPAFVYGIVLIAIIHFGLQYRIYYQYIKHGRKSDLAERFGIDYDDVESYPPSVFEAYVEKQKLESQLKIKEEKIKKVEN